MDNQIILRPIISEKSLNRTAKGLYTFAVFKKADKRQIKKAVEEAFKVNVTAVKTMTMKGKSAKKGKKMKTVARPDWKKAIVQLKKDQKIELFENIGGEAKNE